MLDLLFDDEGADAETGASGNPNKLGRPPGPAAPRNSTRLAGIDNQGATCYLNSLLQTLVLTPELREAFFQLGPEELGKLSDKDLPGAKVRVIPIQLQRLFARLLYLNQESCSSLDLTDSFGWNSAEHFQQHDVQELNQILFSALDDSLVGTAGERVISELYHGTVVNKIVCKTCGRVSEREEDFLDLTLPIKGMVGVSDSLRAMFVEEEVMDGKNQYRCSSCQGLVDATKGAKIRELPPILTLSLLRFSYNLQIGQRYKETCHYTFPLEIDMVPYCEQVPDCDDGVYELYSVVIHSGSPHGGHYHAYIRDIDGIGNWVTPENAPITLKSDPNEGKVDFIEINSPLQLVKTLLLMHGNGHSLPIDKLCQILMKETGMTWNKRFKKHFGPITKFLKKYDDMFVLDSATGVSLKDPFDNRASDNSSSHGDPSPDTSDNKKQNVLSSQTSNTECSSTQKSLSATRCGSRWFDFNDSRVQPIHEDTIQTQFGGRESAYMLFYRKKKMTRNAEVGLLPQSAALPSWLDEELREANENLRIEREIHDLSMNEIKVSLLEADHYEWSSGALQVKESISIAPKCLSLDRRRTMKEVKKAIHESYPELLPSRYCLHTAQDLPAGLHLFDSVSENEKAVIKDLDISDGSMLFLWDGSQVGGSPIRTGAEAQPILLRLSFLDQECRHREIARGYARDTSVRGLFDMVSVLTDIVADQLQLQRMAGDGELTNLDRGDGRIIFEAGLMDEDRLVAEEDRLVAERGSRSPIDKSSKLHEDIHNKLSLTVENRCGSQGMDHTWPTADISIDKNKTVSELKALILGSYFRISGSNDAVRLRVEDENLGLQPPLHEQQTIEDTCIRKNCHLVLEPGLPPKNNEITVTFSLNTKNKETQTWELLVDRSMSCKECLERAIAAVDLEHSDYHLCKTNWCWEEQSIITDMVHSLEEEGVSDGDRLLLKEGRLPPPGYIRCPVWLYPTPHQGFIQQAHPDTERAPWLQEQSEEILASFDDASRSPDIGGSLCKLLGELEISQDARVEEVKQQVATLPLLAAISLPSVDFLRVCTIEKSRLSRVLSGNQTLKQLRVTGTSQLAVQVLPQEEKLKSSQILLGVCQRIPDTRAYTPTEDYVWDTTDGVSPEKLRQALSVASSIPDDRLAMAKRLPEKYEWMEILSSRVMSEKSKNPKRKGKPSQINLKQGPYHIKDGDIIAIKDSQYDPLSRDDFSTEEDDIGKARLSQEIEEKKQLRKEKKKLNHGEVSLSKKKPEVGLSIKVEDFSR